MAQSATDANMSRGEAVLVVGGASTPAGDAADDCVEIRVDALLEALLPLLPLSQVVDLISRWSGERRNRIYERALSLKQQTSAEFP